MITTRETTVQVGNSLKFKVFSEKKSTLSNLVPVSIVDNPHLQGEEFVFYTKALNDIFRDNTYIIVDVPFAYNVPGAEELLKLEDTTQQLAREGKTESELLEKQDTQLKNLEKHLEYQAMAVGNEWLLNNLSAFIGLLADVSVKASLKEKLGKLKKAKIKNVAEEKETSNQPPLTTEINQLVEEINQCAPLINTANTEGDQLKRFKIMRWQEWINDVDYQKNKAAIQALYTRSSKTTQNEEELQKSIRKTARSYAIHQIRKIVGAFDKTEEASSDDKSKSLQKAGREEMIDFANRLSIKHRQIRKKMENINIQICIKA